MLPSTDARDSPLTRRAAIATGVAAATALAGCGGVDEIRDELNPRTYDSDAELGDPPEPWPTPAHDARRTGARGIGTTLPATPTVERVGPGGGDFDEGPPMVDSEAVYAAVHTQAEPEYVRAFVATGLDSDARWRRDWSESKAPAPPTIHGETAFLTRAGETVAVDRRSGELRWRYAAGTAHSTPTAVGDRLYLGANSQRLPTPSSPKATGSCSRSTPPTARCAGRSKSNRPRTRARSWARRRSP